MNKRNLTRILTRATGAEVGALAHRLADKYSLTVVREPARMLVMLPMKEPVRKTPFYIGELLACEAIVELDGHKGVGVCAGDDFRKCLSMAIIDAAFNAEVSEVAWLQAEIARLQEQQDRTIALDSARHQATRVDFHSMDGQ